MRIRVATTDDALAISEIYAYYVRETSITFDSQAPDAAETADSIRRRLPRFPWLVAENDAGTVIGYAYACEHASRHAYRWSANISIYLSDTNRRQGIGGQLYARLFEILRQQGYRMLHAGITLPNAASVAIHEKLGFRPVGVYPKVGHKHGQWHDVGWWSLDLNPNIPTTDPPEPLDFQQIDV